MTRETKIGLLVGLAFIIVVGILLGEQLMRSTEPPPAQVAGVADNVRKGITTPASHAQALPPVTPPRAVSPETHVPTRDEVTPPASPVTVVEIRPGGNGPQPRIPAGHVSLGIGADPSGTSAAVTPPATPNGAMNDGVHGGPVAINGTTRMNPPATPTGRSIADIAAAMGETLLGPDGKPLRATGPLAPVPGTGGRVAEATPPGVRQYKCESGDTLSKIAQKNYGSASKAFCNLIVKANPSLAENPDKVIIGVTYTIPPAPTAAAGVTPTTPTTPKPVAPIAPAAPPANEYVVQPGDNLTRIAIDHCGSAALVPAIKELNRDVLKGGDRITVNMKLKLPAKPIAAAASAR
ncbi:MAG TPA: LysM peptidoglycan-binding domain-containing protein [Tepidisphaeraceae bacterium]|nr:LysM peptidoglycan-binding domain-containing protein [Tepidisphaeraceae bacterium]